MLSPFSVTRKGTLKSNNGDDNKDFKKAIGLYVKQQLSMYSTLFFYIPLPLLQGHDVKMTDFTFNRGRKNANEESFFLFSELGYGSKEFNSKIQESSPAFDKCIKKSFQIFAMEIKRTRIHFLSDVYCAVSICFVR